MQELINITDEMKNDAKNIVNAVETFRKKYNIRIVSCKSYGQEASIAVFDKDTENGEGFYVHYIDGDGEVVTEYIEHDKD